MKRKVFYLDDDAAKAIERLAKRLNVKQSDIVRTMLSLVPYEGDTLRQAIKSKLS